MSIVRKAASIAAIGGSFATASCARELPYYPVVTPDEETAFCGMPPEVVAKAFPSYQADVTGKVTTYKQKDGTRVRGNDPIVELGSVPLPVRFHVDENGASFVSEDALRGGGDLQELKLKGRFDEVTFIGGVQGAKEYDDTLKANVVCANGNELYDVELSQVLIQPFETAPDKSNEHKLIVRGRNCIITPNL